jgi:hypothetical protein
MADPVAKPAIDPAKPIVMIGPDGASYDVPAGQAAEFLKRGGRLETPEEVRAREGAARQEGNEFQAGVEGFLRGSTGAVSDVVGAALFGSRGMAERREAFPEVSMGTEIGGGLLGLGKGVGASKTALGKGLAAVSTPARLVTRAGVAVEKGAERLLAPLAAKGTLGKVAAKGLSMGAGAGTEGAIVGAQQWLSESVLGETEPTVQALIDHVGGGAFLGGVFGGGLGAGGMLAKAGGEKITRGVRDWMAERWAGGGGPLSDVFSEGAGVLSGSGAAPIKRFMRSAEDRELAVNAPKILDDLAAQAADAKNAMIRAEDAVTNRAVGRLKDADFAQMAKEAAPDFRPRAVSTIDAQIAEIDGMLKTPAEYGHLADLRRYKSRLEVARKRALAGESAGDVFNELDSAKQDLGKIIKRELRRKEANSTDRATVDRMRQFYDDESIGLKKALEDESTWGKTVTAAQREENAAWHADLENIRRRPGSQMVEAWEGGDFWDTGKLSRQARTAGVRDYFEKLGTLASREDTPWLLDQMVKRENLLDTIAKHRALTEVETAALAEF